MRMPTNTNSSKGKTQILCEGDDFFLLQAMKAPPIVNVFLSLSFSRHLFLSHKFMDDRTELYKNAIKKKKTQNNAIRNTTLLMTDYSKLLSVMI